MPTRYNTNSNIRVSYKGNRFFGTRTYPYISQRPDDILYITNEMDYLDTLAYKFYKDGTLWWIIALANGLGTGRLSVESGIQLRIPVNSDTILNQYNAVN